MKKSTAHLSLILPFLLSAGTGIGLHLAGHRADRAAEAIWSLCHIATSLLFLFAVAHHLHKHRFWYRGVLHGGLAGKSRITAVLSVIFPLVLMTGVAAWCGAIVPSAVGIWHYRAGLLLILLAGGHILTRLRRPRKGRA